jgi:hypothetical protein
VNQALLQGANAIEPDVNVFDSDHSRICIDHGPDIGTGGGSDTALALEDYLSQLNTIAHANPQLALVVFDCKTLVCTAAHGTTLLNAIRNVLAKDIDLNIIISVATIDHAILFQNIIGTLGPFEGVMVDEENDPRAISNLLANAQNQCFGDGIAVLNGILGPNIRPAIEHACQMRAAENRIRFIYTWAVNALSDQREFLDIGLDGMITDEIPCCSTSSTMIPRSTRGFTWPPAATIRSSPPTSPMA